MTTDKEINVYEILEDLSYSWSSPEAKDFQEKVKQEKYKSAEKMLKNEGLGKKEVEAVMNYFKEKYHAKKVLVEILPQDYETLQNRDNVLVSYGNVLSSTTISNEEDYTHHKGNCFFDKDAYHYVPLKQATQVWKIEVVKN